jgi:hypothetical protein
MAKWSRERIEADPAVYRETIVVMMRYGGCVDQIAKDLGMSEGRLVDYIRLEGLDVELGRRSWRWKSKSGKKRRRGQAMRDRSMVKGKRRGTPR